ncbi:AraC family transcriptional regulator [Dyadobacter sp. 3J3]|uniref:helix-turn-helix transcriptional regulator n=1 Tax=Dyadobacter sp. 3J3 TaxID=2606600 RepID=UPI00135CDA52|nr:AraC family transcriptional regulator [Dyadobacter sp. 3J3]
MITHQEPTVPNILKGFAHLLGADIKNRRLEIPEKFGKGYCSGFVFNEHIRMLILNYELNEDMIVENPGNDSGAKMILFKFQNIFPKTEKVSNVDQFMTIPSVLIATIPINTDAILPIHTHTATINIEMDANYLNGLFDTSEKSPVLQSLLQNTQPLVFEHMINPSLQKIVDEIVFEPIDPTFQLFFLRVKAEELICRLLLELDRRNEKNIYDLNAQDIQILYKIKDQMLTNLATPPVIKELAANAHMSPTKLKRLFSQIFGNSIFNYYQQFRMKEAALLLKTEKLSVSEVGYRLGFTNLSHFSKVFNDHIGMKPKQYSRS